MNGRPSLDYVDTAEKFQTRDDSQPNSNESERREEVRGVLASQELNKETTRQRLFTGDVHQKFENLQLNLVFGVYAAAL
ncbi:hypothetical protein EYF80_039568 [Liparis tanakae]|uniref:Uncharacterized protein n=1 Tax=Liparis tanakae TaxID=230148 RepID=A0A4Z2GAJ1_9TELE|nr:hypothetical protein EYF80_039568 [Liparis tanakae]